MINLLCIAVNTFQGRQAPQSVDLKKFSGSARQASPWHDWGLRWVLPGLGILRVIRTTVYLLITLLNKGTTIVMVSL
jgi:hypothetical protein